MNNRVNVSGHVTLQNQSFTTEYVPSTWATAQSSLFDFFDILRNPSTSHQGLVRNILQRIDMISMTLRSAPGMSQLCSQPTSLNVKGETSVVPLPTALIHQQ
jgi:hypothetical protein